MGISRYDSSRRTKSTPYSRLHPLNYPETDAKALTERFRKSFSDSIEGPLAGSRATANSIQGCFATNARAIEKATSVVFYFSGHGHVQNVIAQEDGQDKLVPDLCLHCHDSEGLGSDNDCLRLRKVVDWMIEVPAQNYVVIVDSCRQSASTLASARAGELAQDMENRLLARVRAKQPSAAVLLLLSCSPGQTSVEDDENKRGLFTGALLDELADCSHEPRNWQEVFDGVGIRMWNRLLALAAKEPQRPQSFPRDLRHFEMALNERVLVRPTSRGVAMSLPPSASAPAKPPAREQGWIAVPQGPLSRDGGEVTTTGPFRIARLPALREEYELFLRETQWPPSAADRKTKRSGPFATGVSFQDIEAFCEWFGYRLPTQVEWTRAVQCGLIGPPEGDCWEWIDAGNDGRRLARKMADPNSRIEHVAGHTAGDLGFRYVDASGESNPPVDGLEECPEIPTISRVVLGVPRRGWLRESERIGLSQDKAASLASEFGPREVSIPAFRIRKYPVTNEEFFEFAKYQRQYWPHLWRTEYFRLGAGSNARPFLEKYKYHPVAGVSYEAAEAYCRWRRVRLPANDEWEVAARGSDSRLYPWGNGFEDHRANFRQMELGRTTRVDDLYSGKSEFGCCEMAGNVWEWTAEDPQGRRFLRGGSYEDDGRSCGLSFNRIPASPDRRPLAGFRYVLP
ncbi:MAG: SUMF1/EgtB/PvdO family nonheme iron enzyme [Bryobacteraceae bacterium]